jgi:peptidoglycan hydrolase-like amidase
MSLLRTICIAIIVFLSIASYTYADEYEDITNKLTELKRSLESSQKATENNEETLKKLNSQLEGIKVQVSTLQNAINIKEKEVKVGEKALTHQKELLNQRAYEYYKNIGKNSTSLMQLLVAEDLSTSLQNFFYQKTVVDEDKRMIIKIVMYIRDLDEKKSSLEKETNRLAVIKQEVDRQSQFLAGEVASAKTYQGNLQKQIAELSARQQEIVNSRSGSFTVNIGDSDLADDYNASIKGFRESAPGGYFAVFAFGAHTHRKGMSQYGARGRAQSGQDFKTILKAYYGKEPVSKDTGGSIKVSGYGEMDFETAYLYGIAEMPSSWDKEALKAQAVAARTYAYRFKQEGKEICTNEACQVFNKSKSDSVPDSWKQAVDETKGQVLEDVVTYYSSTAGGYSTTSGWDTTDSAGGTNFIDKAYEKTGGSPWLYKAWYTQGYSTSSDKCGRSSPWLSPVEMADIVNAALILTKGTTEEASRISPVTTSCWGGNPYSHDELRNVAQKYGGISSASSVSVEQGDGTTSRVTIDGVTLSGSDFKRAFNLRGPGYVSIPQYQFAFFNIEKK